MYPEQVVVEGHNVTGDCIKVISLHCDASLPMYKTPASQVATYNETDEFLGGMPLSVFVSAGPYTTRYVSFTPQVRIKTVHKLVCDASFCPRDQYTVRAK
jgi:hypothetical protein